MADSGDEKGERLHVVQNREKQHGFTIREGHCE